ncbi:alpha/beta hydrolase [Actinomycetaceae bacterium TAE3-ERU4]|nr:alpha/beta hydrolase [Actinomycetaceae bacterium TAE3-ERU4]
MFSFLGAKQVDASLRPASWKAVLLHNSMWVISPLRALKQRIFAGTRWGAKVNPFSLADYPIYPGWKVDEISLDRCSAFWLQPTSSRDFSNSSLVILELHGGSYLHRFKRGYAKSAYFYSQAAGKASVFSVDYRVAPNNPFPAALEDAQKGYEFLRSQGYEPSQIVLAGDSAGAGLALALAMKLRDEGVDFAFRAMVLFSPWADLAARGYTHETNCHRDPLFGRLWGRVPKFRGDYYAGEAGVDYPLVSPVYGDFSNLPPAVLFAGSTEILLSDSRSVASKIHAAGGVCRFYEMDRMLHVGPLFFKNLSDSRWAWWQVESFLTDLEA